MNIKDTKYGNLSLKKIYNNNIELQSSGITSLEGLPKEIGGSLYIRSNLLTTLEHCSSRVLGNIDCSNNNLISLKGSPKEINGSFNCQNNNLTSLKGRPKKVKGFFICKNNPDLKDVKQEIIENQIKSSYYLTDERFFDFEEIKEEFLKYSEILLKKEKELKSKKIKKDYGLSI